MNRGLAIEVDDFLDDNPRETTDFSLVAEPLVPCLNGLLFKTEVFFDDFLTSVDGAATEFLLKSLPGGPLT